MDRIKTASIPALYLFARRFLILYGGQTILSVIRLWLKSRSMLLVLWNRSNAEFALSIAGISSSYKFWITMLKNTSNFKRYSVSGALSAIFLAVDRDTQRSAMISQAIFVRTLYFVIRIFTYVPAPSGSHKKVQMRESTNLFSKFVRNMIHKCGNWIVWVSLAYRVCYASWVTPELLRKNYYDQLVYITGSNKRLNRDAKDLITGASRINNELEMLDEPHSIETIPANKSSKQHLMKYLNELPRSSKLWMALNNIGAILKYIPDDNVHHDNLSCLTQHPWDSNCNTAAYGIAKDVLSVTIPIFTKLNSASLIFSISKVIYKSHRNKKSIEFKRVAHSIYKSITATIQSSLMLTAFISIFSLSVCNLRVIFGRSKGIMYGIAGAIATPTILLDKPGRLLEFNTFLVSKTLEQLNIWLYRKFGLRYTKFNFSNLDSQRF